MKANRHTAARRARLKPRHAGMLGCLAMLNACAVGTDYKPPSNKLDNHWDALAIYDTNNPRAQYDIDRVAANANVTVSSAPVLPSGPWWKQFHDDTLSMLIDKALSDNNDLMVAVQRVVEARANQRYAMGQLLPEIDASGSVTRATLDALNSSKPDTISQGGLSGNWDIDLFGGNRRREEAARAATQATEEDFAQARLNVIADVARFYSHLRADQRQYALTMRNLGIQRDTLRITNALRKANDVTELDVARVQAQIATTEARLPQIRTDMYASLHRLGVLTGQQPAALREQLMPDGPMLAMPDNLVVLSPVATIAERPDVHAAERRLAQASALSNAAFAQLFPTISLNAFFGARNSAYFGALSPWSATAQAMFPLLDFGRIRAQMHGADARQEEAFHTYKQTVLTALEDTENDLIAYIDEQRRSALLHDVAVEETRAVNIARTQYRAGIVTQLDLLDAERNALDAESNWVLSMQTATDDLIQLYHSLGMGPVAPAKPAGDPPANDPPARKPFADNPVAAPAAVPVASPAPAQPDSQDSADADAAPTPKRGYIVYAGHFATLEHARQVASDLSDAGPIYIDKVKAKWVVHTGRLHSRDAAGAALDKIRSTVPDAYIAVS